MLNLPTTDSLGFFCSSDSDLASFAVVVLDKTDFMVCLFWYDRLIKGIKVDENISFLFSFDSLNCHSGNFSSLGEPDSLGLRFKRHVQIVVIISK